MTNMINVHTFNEGEFSEIVQIKDGHFAAFDKGFDKGCSSYGGGGWYAMTEDDARESQTKPEDWDEIPDYAQKHFESYLSKNPPTRVKVKLDNGSQRWYHIADLMDCPTCKKKSVRAKTMGEGGGVKCIDDDCHYWECY